ncbi:hypothetical protein TMHG_02343 [Mycobacterium tuberculosis SUMu008]|nr:hypothetical protein TMHG_02343 [Mycobacterium tuberculosis SUMu008]
MGRSVAKRRRKPRSLKYSYDALKVLQRVWSASGGQCGKYLAASMVNRPGMSGDSSSWKGWGHVRWFIEEVPAGAA